MIREFITGQNFFPSVILTLYGCTSLRYAIAGEWGRVLYWLCAAGITASVTYLIK